MKKRKNYTQSLVLQEKKKRRKKLHAFNYTGTVERERKKTEESGINKIIIMVELWQDWM